MDILCLLLLDRKQNQVVLGLLSKICKIIVSCPIYAVCAKIDQAISDRQRERDLECKSIFFAHYLYFIKLNRKYSRSCEDRQVNRWNYWKRN